MRVWRIAAVAAVTGVLGASGLFLWMHRAAPPAWAFPVLAAPSTKAPPVWSTVKNSGGAAPGAASRVAAVLAGCRAAAGRPLARPPAPAIVREGRRPAVEACGFCHLPEGSGRPENAVLAGLPADYIERQLADMRSGARRSSGGAWRPASLMEKVAAAATPQEVEAAARYFAARPYTPHTRVIEAAAPPKAVAVGAIYRFATDGTTERLGRRILEGPDDFERFELRDDLVGYVAYVPPGAIARGARLARTGGGGRTQVCGACHGDRLQGMTGPPLAGRSPTGLFRQLYGFKTGARRGAASAAMREVTARLDINDMIDLSAYAGSLR